MISAFWLREEERERVIKRKTLLKECSTFFVPPSFAPPLHTYLPHSSSSTLHLTFIFPLSVHPICPLSCDFFLENLLSLPGLRLFSPSLPPSALPQTPPQTPLVVFDSSKAGIRRANSRWTHSNTQLCHLLQSHDWAEHHDAPSYLTHRSIMTKKHDREWERRNSENENKL